MVELTQRELARRKFDEEIYHLDVDRYLVSDLIAEHGPDIYLQIARESSYYGDDETTVKIVREIEESDEVYEARIAALRKEKAAKKAKTDAAKLRDAKKDRAVYERLKSKYGW